MGMSSIKPASKTVHTNGSQVWDATFTHKPSKLSMGSYRSVKLENITATAIFGVI